MVKITDYLRRSSKFLRPDDVKDGDIVEIVSEGTFRPAEESRFGREDFLIDVKLPDGSTKTWTMNKTTLRNLMEAYGDETKNWVGRKVKINVRVDFVRGVPRKVLYGFAAEGEAERVKSFVADVARYYSEIDIEAFGRLIMMRGLNVKPEDAAVIGGAKIVEKEGRKFVVFRQP